MKKWKVIRAITLIVLILFLFVIGSFALGILIDPTDYSTQELPLTKWETFGIIVGNLCFLSALPMTVDMILLFISIRKLRKTGPRRLSGKHD